MDTLSCYRVNTDKQVGDIGSSLLQNPDAGKDWGQAAWDSSKVFGNYISALYLIQVFVPHLSWHDLLH